MSGMGMDMGMEGPFKGENTRIAHAYWYIIAAIAGIRGFRTIFDQIRTRIAKRQSDSRGLVPSQPSNIFIQSYETCLTICRELTYPTMKPFSGSISRYFTIPPLGQCLTILTYWIILLIMLWTNVLLPKSDDMYAYHWEKVGFRAAWISVTQIPFIYALSCKFNIISIVTGVSYDRLNWLHRWAARTLFLTVIVHWSHFYREWDLASFVKWELKLMPMVKYGFGAWAVLGWAVLTGFGFFRTKIYELWIIQHLATAGVLLWLLYVHVPSYARYNIWMAIGFVVFDRTVRGFLSVWRNLHIRGLGRTNGQVGFKTEVEPLPHDYVRVTLKDVNFSWRAGQHIYLSIPSVLSIPFESHPFTIASSASTSSESTKDLTLYLKVHNGFTKRLLGRARKNFSSGNVYTPKAFISGPWGIPPLPSLERANSLIFICSSTGASFTIPLLEHAINHAPFVQRISFHWIVRFEDQIDWFRIRLQDALQRLQTLGLENVECRIYVTGLTKVLATGSDIDSARSASSTTEKEIVNTNVSDQKEKKPLEALAQSVSNTSSESISQTTYKIDYSVGRPDSFVPLMRPTIEAARGETVIVACGSRELVASVRNTTGKLSDERAVHKGTGAQGLYFFGETYGW